jgi:hypothetical protein
VGVAAWALRPPIWDAQDGDRATDIADAAQEIPFAGYPDDQAWLLLLDTLARLLASANDRCFHAVTTRQRSGLVHLLLAKAPREKNDHSLWRSALGIQAHERVVDSHEGMRQSILVDRQEPTQPEDADLDHGQNPAGQRRRMRAARPIRDQHDCQDSDGHAKQDE